MVGLGAVVVVVRYDMREYRVGRQLRQVLTESFMVIRVLVGGT